MKIRIILLIVLVLGVTGFGQYEKLKCPEGGVFVILTVDGVVQQSGCIPDTTQISLPINPAWQRVFIEIETE